MTLTGRAALLAVAGAVLAPFGWPPLATLWVVLLLGVGWDLARAGRVGDLRMSRSGATAARLGDTVVVTLVVTNTGVRPVRGWLRDAWVPSAGARPRVHAVDLPPGERRRFDLTLTPTRRGDRTPAQVTVRSVGPLGLAARQRRHSVGWLVRVLPPFGSRRFLPEKLARLRQLDGAVALNRRGQGTEFDSLRDYVDGDDVRSIDWRATARRDAVVVRTWRPERDRRLVCVLDTGRTSAARVGDIPRLDASLDACLLLAAVAARAGDRVDLVAVDSVLRASVEGAAQREVLPRLVQAMAPLEPALVESDADLVVSEVLRRQRRRCLVVLFTALDAAAIEQGLLPVVDRLTRRHTVLLASVGDPRVDELAARRGTATAVYEAASAERTLADRRRITASLRRHGVIVVDEAADRFASRVADAYLDLKATGRL
ncbi:MAG TPA: DUF58 domain-containing protein [Mycobacteriales bacterium]